MKKIFALLFASMMILSLGACGRDSNRAVEIATPGDLDAQGLRIGTQLGSTGHAFADENFVNGIVMAYDSNVDVIQALLSGDVDAVIMDSEPARHFVAQNEDRLRQLDELLTKEDYGIALPPGSPYTALFNEAIQTLQENGTLYNLIAYWVLEDSTATRYTSPEGTSHPNGTLRMGTSADFPPFEFWEGNEVVGLEPDIARAIGDLLGYEIEILDMDFATIILAVQTGQVDFGMAGMTITPERLEQVDFTQSHFLSGQSVIVRIA